MQNKLFKRILTGVLSAALVITSANFAPEQTEAAKKVKSMTISTVLNGETIEVNKKDLVPLQLVDGEAQHFDVEIEGAGSFKVTSKNKAIKAKKDADATGFDVSGSRDKKTKVIVTSTKKKKNGKKIKKWFYVTIETVEAAKSLEVSINESSILVGATATISYTVDPSTVVPVFSSSNEAIAKVDDKGVVTGVSAGNATITVSVPGIQKTVDVTVTDKEPEPIPEEGKLKGVSLDVTAPKVGDIINAITDPEKATDVDTYLWEAVAGPTSETGDAIGASASVTITDDMVGKFIKVTVTAKAVEGEEAVSFSAVTSSAVIKDNTESVTITDINGLQSDGTGLVTDTLHLSYGSGMGVPKLITWYYNDTVAKSQLAEADKMDTILNFTPDGKITKEGQYYVVITTDDGKTFTSNTIELVTDELPGSVSNFAIADDYSDPANLTYTKDDTNAIMCITLKKAYDSTFWIFEDKQTGYTAAKSITDQSFIWNDAAINAGGQVWEDAAGVDYVPVTTFDKLTPKNVMANPGAAGIYYTAVNGETTIMWKIAAGDKLRRGTSYKLIYDQAAIEDDTIATEPNKKVEPTDSFEAPYLTAPAGIELVTTAIGQKATANFVDENGETLTWFGNDETVGAANSAIESVFVYGNDSAKDAGKVKQVDAGKIKKGTYTSNGPIPDDKSVYYVEAKTKAGIFAAEAATLKSEWKTQNLGVAKSLKLTENGTTPTSADIAIKGLVAPATVYVIKSSNYTTASAFDPDSSDVLGSVEVKVGQGEATISGVFEAEDAQNNEEFQAILVPDDETAFARYDSTADADDDDNNLATFVLKQNPSSIAYDGTSTNVGVAEEQAEATGGADNPVPVEIKTMPIVIKDQFGEALVAGKFNTITNKAATVTANNGGGVYSEKGDAMFSVDATKALTVTLKRQTGVDGGDGFKVNVLGADLVVKAAVSLPVTGENFAGLYTVDLGTDHLVTTAAQGATVGTVTTYTKLAAALLSSDTKTINVTDDITIPAGASLTVAEGQTVNLAAKKIIINAGGTLTNNGTITTGDSDDAGITVNGDLKQHGAVTDGHSTNQPTVSGTGKVYVDTDAKVAAVAVTGAFYTGTYTVVAENGYKATGAINFTKKLVVATGTKLEGGANIITFGDDTDLSGATFTSTATNVIANGKKIIMNAATTISGVKFATSGTADNTALLDNGTAVVTLVDNTGTAATSGTNIPTASTAWPTTATSYKAVNATVTNTSGTYTILGTVS